MAFTNTNRVHNHPEETVFVIDQNNKKISQSSFLDPTSVAQSHTVADIQQSLEPHHTGIIGGTNPDEDQKIIQNILLMVKKHERRRMWWLILLGLLLAPCTYFLLICVPFCMYKYGMSKLNRIVESGIRYMIRLEGEQWSRYVQHIQKESKGKMNKSIIKELVSRGYGHILLGIEGFFLDAMLSMQYENIIIERTEIIQAPNNIDMILRLWFCRRLVVIRTANGHTTGNMNDDPFKFDLFLPSSMSTELLNSIVNFLKLESRCRPNFVV